jgi:hypothetical protein
MEWESPSSHPLTGLAGRLGAFLLGAVLLVAAWTKVIHPEAFAEQIRNEGLDFLFPAMVVVFIALALEVGLGTALILNLRRAWVLVPSALLVIFFLFLTGRTYWRSLQGIEPESASCGCFGNLVQRTPAEAFWQDLILLVPPLVLACLGRYWGRGWLRAKVAVAGVVTVAALVLTWKAPELPLDDLATRLKPGVAVADLCAGGEEDRVCLDTLLPELLTGEHLVVMATLEEDSGGIGEETEALNGYVLEGRGPALWVATSALEEEIRAFFWARAPAFEIREVPEPLMAPLYRRLPRSFAVADGIVKNTYSGLPPQIETGADAQDGASGTGNPEGEPDDPAAPGAQSSD